MHASQKLGLLLCVACASAHDSVDMVQSRIEREEDVNAAISRACASVEVRSNDGAEEKFTAALKGFSGGSWSPCTHLKQYGLNHSPGFVRFLAHQLQPKSYLEFGSGLGTMADYVRRFAKADVTVIEPNHALGELGVMLGKTAGGELHQLALDVTSGDAEMATCEETLKTTKFDVVTSVEVLEHIPLKYHKKIVSFLASAVGKYLVFSAARPKQAGTGHIEESEFDAEHWRKTFEDEGLVYMTNLTKYGRESALYHRSYDLFANLIVMKNPSYAAEDIAEPTELIALKDTPGGQYATIYTEPFSAHWHKIDGDLRHAFDVEALRYQTQEEEEVWPELTRLRSMVHRGEIPCDGVE